MKRLPLPHRRRRKWPLRNGQGTELDGNGVITKRERRLHLATDLPASKLIFFFFYHSDITHFIFFLPGFHSKPVR